MIFENVDDLNQPYSCEMWGDLGESGIPILTNDAAGYNFFNLFGNSYTWSVVLGPDLVVKYSGEGEVSSIIIFNILDEYQLDPFNYSNGDANMDELINIMDIILIIGNINLSISLFLLADMNEDGIINAQDVIIIINIILGNN